MAEDKDIGIGIDFGTGNLVSARRQGKKIVTSRIRNAFIDLPIESKRMLKLSKTSHIEYEGKLIVLGDEALDTANLMNRESRRPMSGGILAAGELDAQVIISLMAKKILGDPKVEREKCCYCIPAPAVDVRGSDIHYHKMVLKKILEELGYTPTDVNEGLAIIFSECADEGFCGLGISYGCLTSDTKIFTRNDLKCIYEIKEGDVVLTRDGSFSRVKKTWSKHHSGPVYEFSFFGNPDKVTLTGNHRVWANRLDVWQWITADSLTTDDIIGEPIVRSKKATKNRVISLKEKHGNGPSKTKNVNISGNVCRFLGYFLADGHVGSTARGTICFDFGPNEREYAEDIVFLSKLLFDRSISIFSHGNAIRCSMSHKSLCSWLRNHCYESVNGRTRKCFPFHVEELTKSDMIGFVTGLVRGDGHVISNKTTPMVKFGNSSTSLITSYHLMLGRLGLTSTISCRSARSAPLVDGRIKSVLDEWNVIVSGDDAKYLSIIVNDSNQYKNEKVWMDGGFRCTRIRDIKKIQYDGLVHDITVEGDPSFSAPYMTLHNSGMTNVCLAYHAMSALEFSLGRGGDYIDNGAAKAVGTTAARICSIKENKDKPIDINKPVGREQEAIALYVQALIDYTIVNIISHFSQAKSEILVPKPIPLIISGGTSLAQGFVEKFRERFEQKRDLFPIQISEIRPAKDPMTAVATGLLILSTMED